MTVLEGSFVYSVDGEYYNYNTVDEAISCAVNTHENVKVGDLITLSRGTCSRRRPSDYFGFHDAMGIIEQIQCNADDEVGECADDMSFVEKEGIVELETLVQAWANKHMSCSFYAVVNTEDFQVVLEQKHFD